MSMSAPGQDGESTPSFLASSSPSALDQLNKVCSMRPLGTNQEHCRVIDQTVPKGRFIWLSTSSNPVNWDPSPELP